MVRVKRYYLKSSSSYYYLKVSSIYLFIIGPNYKYIYLYLTTNTKHFYPVILACEYMRKTHNKLDRKEANVLFNNALNTFYLLLYGVRHMVKDHSDSERGNLLPPHRILFPISSKGSFISIILQTGCHISWALLHQSWSSGWNKK